MMGTRNRGLAVNIAHEDHEEEQHDQSIGHEQLVVFDVIKINLITTNAHYCRGNQSHGQVFAGGVFADYYR